MTEPEAEEYERRQKGLDHPSYTESAQAPPRPPGRMVPPMTTNERAFIVFMDWRKQEIHEHIQAEIREIEAETRRVIKRQREEHLRRREETRSLIAETRQRLQQFRAERQAREIQEARAADAQRRARIRAEEEMRLKKKRRRERKLQEKRERNYIPNLYEYLQINPLRPSFEV